MLEGANGVNLQPTNFCKTVGVLAQSNLFCSVLMDQQLIKASAHNLIELIDYGVESPDHHYGHMIQSFHRFLMDALSSEGDAYPHNPWLLPHSDAGGGEPLGEAAFQDPAPAPITQLCGVDAKNVITCTSCGAVREKGNMVHVVDLVYPKKVCSQYRPKCWQ